MIEELEPYPRMKDSGVEWLGELPEHWEVKRLRNVAGLRVSNIDKHSREDEEPVRLCNYVDVYKHDRITPGMPFMKATASRADVERFRLCVDDVLITKDSESWNDIGVPSLVDCAADDLVSGYHLALLRPIRDRIKGGYLFRLLQSPAGACQFHVEAKGVTRYGLSHGAIKSVFLPVPPLAEQAAIVRFLDYADRRIRRYIRAKQKLIKLFEEQKQAIIYRSVTHGLDADVRLKDSGVAWLGEIPEHWEVMRVKHFARVGNGSTPSRGRSEYWTDGEYPWLSSGSVNAHTIMDAKEFVTEAALRECHLPQVSRGSVLVAITGQGKTRGTAALLEIDATINQHLAFVTPRGGTHQVEPGFLRACLGAAYSELRRISDNAGSTKGALTCGDIRNFSLALPCVVETGPDHRASRLSDLGQ